MVEKAVSQDMFVTLHYGIQINSRSCQNSYLEGQCSLILKRLTYNDNTLAKKEELE